MFFICTFNRIRKQLDVKFQVLMVNWWCFVMTDLSQGGAKKLKLMHLSVWKAPLIKSLVDLSEIARNDNK